MNPTGETLVACFKLVNMRAKLIKTSVGFVRDTKIQDLDAREITSLPEIKKVIYVARHFNHRGK